MLKNENWNVKVQIHSFLIPVLDGGDWSGSRSAHFTAVEVVLRLHWVGSTGDLGALKQGQTLCSYMVDSSLNVMAHGRGSEGETGE
jgi:hypothetical protein